MSTVLFNWYAIGLLGQKEPNKKGQKLLISDRMLGAGMREDVERTGRKIIPTYICPLCILSTTHRPECPLTAIFHNMQQNI